MLSGSKDVQESNAKANAAAGAVRLAIRWTVFTSVVSRKYLGIRTPLHPAWLRYSSSK
jgi:hypothetical protein